MYTCYFLFFLGKTVFLNLCSKGAMVKYYWLKHSRTNFLLQRFIES